MRSTLSRPPALEDDWQPPVPPPPPRRGEGVPLRDGEFLLGDGSETILVRGDTGQIVNMS